tara:strand:- start:8170 stop:8352 length:183 start_codon:yes stop_codon:yes gene_type:complete
MNIRKQVSPKVWNLIAITWTLGGVVALLTYLDNKKITKMREEVMLLDKKIKEHELQKHMN